MAACNGPKIDISTLLYTQQPGITTRYMTTGGTTVSHGLDVLVPTSKSVIGPQRTNDSLDGQTYGSIQTIECIGGNIHPFTIGKKYSISLWVRISGFPSKINGSRYPRGKRQAIVRLNYSNQGSQNISGFVELGAMAPFYLDIFNSNPNYKLEFSPLSFGAAISTSKYTVGVYTDYKFLANTWYLISLEIEGSYNLDVVPNTIIAKMFVNNVQEDIAYCLGIPWKNKKQTSLVQKRIRSGRVAGQPGFYNVTTGATISHGPTMTLWGSSSGELKHTPNFNFLNHISYSPIAIFSSDVNEAYLGGNNGGNVDYNDGIKRPHIPRGKNVFNMSSWIDTGQIFIRNNSFSSEDYTSFRYLYN